MEILVLVFHPNITQSRVNKKMAESIANEDNVIVRNMYDIYPDFKINVEQEQNYLLKADRIILQFPFYWYSTPSLLKQWEDDVLTYGWAFGSDGDKLHGKELLISTTTGADGYSRSTDLKYTVEDLLRPLQATSNLIGTRYIKPFIINNSMAIDNKQIEGFAQNFATYALNENLDVLGDYE